MEQSVERLEEHLQDDNPDVLNQWAIEQLKVEYTDCTCGRTHVPVSEMNGIFTLYEQDLKHCATQCETAPKGVPL